MERSERFIISLIIGLFLYVLAMHVSILWVGYDLKRMILESPKSATATATDTTEDEATASANSKDGASEYVTYFDLAYDAYTNPDKFLDKEITLVGYYSNSAVDAGDTTESVETESTSEANEYATDGMYHFITAYGQVNECHITAEFTTADGVYPETIGTVIKITGKFTSYEENGSTYYTIAADSYSVVNA